MSLRLVAKRALPYLPQWLQRQLRSRQEQQRLAEHAERKKRTQVSVDEVLELFADMKLTKDVIIHGSISNIGKLDKPVTVLVDRLLAMLDLSKQTVLVPALPYNTKTMREHLSESVSFDVRTARNAMGAISTMVMSRPGARRSVHPTHSLVALGADADAYTARHHLDPTPFGPGSPYWRLTAKGGHILMIGVGLNSVTCFHVYEDFLGGHLPFQVYLPESFRVPCVDSEGQALTVTTTCHNPKLSVVRECERARPWLNAAGAIRTKKLGESELSVIDARLFTRTLLEHLHEGESIYGKVKLRQDQREAIRDAIRRMDDVTA